LSSKALKTLHQHASGRISKDYSSSDDAPSFRRLVLGGFFVPEICERYYNVAVYKPNAGNFAGEDLLCVEGIFQGRL
jgi:hypothetical protein